MTDEFAGLELGHRSTEQEGLAVASIARDVVVRLPLPVTTMHGKFGSEF